MEENSVKDCGIDFPVPGALKVMCQHLQSERSRFPVGMAEEEKVLERAIALRERSLQCITRSKYREFLDARCLERSRNALARSRESLRRTRIGSVADQKDIFAPAKPDNIPDAEFAD
jgi:hypothetical protein